MSRAARLARRAVAMVLAAWLVVSVVFLLVALSREGGRVPSASAYLDFLVGVATFDWGTTRRGEPVTGAIADALWPTLRYVVPAMALSVGVGVAVGLYAALNRHGWVDRLGSAVAYAGYGVPGFFLASLLLLAFAMGDDYQLQRDDGVVQMVVWPATVLALSLVAGQLRHARSQSMEYLGTDFVKLVRAKGATDFTVAKHVLRNAAVPLFSLFFVDMLAVLVLNIYVIEAVFDIEGVGKLSFMAVRERNLPVVLGTTMLFVFVGIVGNFLQDVAYETLDPRVKSE